MSETDTGENEADSRMPVDLRDREKDGDRDEEASEQEENTNQESGLNTNYDSSDGAIPMHRCEGCDYETMSRPALSRHSAVCQGGKSRRSSNNTVGGTGSGLPPSSSSSSTKMFECDICQMRFSNGANMRRHKMRHTGVKPYECRVCGKRFFRKDHLAEHTTTHAKALPWACPICHRGFQRQIAMRAHFQNEHVANSSTGPNGEAKCCPLCSYKATSMKSLRVHFYNRHGIDLDRPSLLTNGGDRALDNTTPPMHFLTPHIEISTHGSLSHNGETEEGTEAEAEMSPGGSPESADSNAPTSSLSSGGRIKIEPKNDFIVEEWPVNVEANGCSPANAEANGCSPVNLCTSARVKAETSPLVRLLANGGPHSPVNIPTVVEELPGHSHPGTGDTCGHCGIRFPDRTLYFLHKGCHAEGNPWKCNICGEQTSNVYDFNSHLLSNKHQ